MSDLKHNYLAIDLGKRRSGLAFWAANAQLALPLRVVESTSVKAFIDLLCLEAQNRQADFVLGLPLHSDGREHRWTKSVRVFAFNLGRASGRQVFLQDETLSSVEAQDLAREQGRAPGAAIDDLAALVILQDFVAKHGAKKS